MKDLRFSIVIPTRNRANTLKYCLKTCIDQKDFNNYEIIVCDNNSTPETKQVVIELNSDKIKYISTGKTLAMYENFDLALSQASGEYVISLGDDDGLCLKGLYNLDQVITKTNHKAIAWNWIFYYWPTGVNPGYENILHIPLTKKLKIVNGKTCINDVINCRISYPNLPMLYINGAIHRDLIKELKNKTGRIISSVTPDSYSGICFAYLSKYFLYMHNPVSIAGISGNSNGNNQLNKKWDNKITKEFNDLNSSAAIRFNSKIPNLRSINAIVIEAFTQAKEKLFPDDTYLSVNRKTIIKNCIKDIIVFDSKEWDNSMEIIRDSLKDDKLLTEWFNVFLLGIKPRITTIVKRDVGKGLDEKETLTLNASSFECENVYDVAKFYDKAFESDIYVPNSLIYNKNNNYPTTKFLSIKNFIKRAKIAGRLVIKGY